MAWNSASLEHKQLEWSLGHTVCVGDTGNQQHSLRIYVNIAGCEEFLLGIHLSVRYRSLRRRQRTWDYQIQAFCRHGWHKRNATITGCEKNVYQTTVHHPVQKWARLVACRHEKRWAPHPERCPNTGQFMGLPSPAAFGRVKLVLGTVSPNDAPNKWKQRTTRRKPSRAPIAAWAPCPGNYRVYFDFAFVQDGAYLHFTTRMRHNAPFVPKACLTMGPPPRTMPGQQGIFTEPHMMIWFQMRTMMFALVLPDASLNVPLCDWWSYDCEKYFVTCDRYVAPTSICKFQTVWL